jgi:hypothetical protein
VASRASFLVLQSEDWGRKCSACSSAAPQIMDKDEYTDRRCMGVGSSFQSMQQLSWLFSFARECASTHFAGFFLRSGKD